MNAAQRRRADRACRALLGQQVMASPWWSGATQRGTVQTFLQGTGVVVVHFTLDRRYAQRGHPMPLHAVRRITTTGASA